MNLFHRLGNYLRHAVTATNSKGHGIHSPFLYEFVTYVVMEKLPYYCFGPIEEYRSTIQKETGKGKRLLPASRAQLLFRICSRYNFTTVTAIGTSLGLTSLCLSSASKKIKCCSIETDYQSAQLAGKLLKKAGYAHLPVHAISNELSLQQQLHETGTSDLFFIDTNHPYSTITDYFNSCLNFIKPNSIIVVNDPYGSKGATRAWKELQHNEKVTATFDLYQLGIVFFNPEFAPKNYKLRY